MVKKPFFICLIAALGFLYYGAASAVSMSLSPSNLNVVEGSSFDVDVLVSELAGNVVSTFDFTIGYNPTLLTATNVSFSGNLGLTDIDTISGFDLLTTPGEISAFEISLLFGFQLDPLQPGDTVQVATLSFTADSVGSTSLSFLSLIVGGEDPLDPFFTVLDITPPPENVAGAGIDVSPIPLPGAVWLMITGLLGIGAMVRKRSAAQ